MKITIETTVDEIERSDAIRELIECIRAASPSVEEVGGEVADREEPEGEEPPATSATDSDDVPGVAPAGQSVVKARLLLNPAGDLVRSFLDTVTSWADVEVSPISPKGKSAGAPPDFSRYLRINKTGSEYGAFVYIWPHSGRVDLRLSYPTDAELHAIAPAAYRYLKSNPVYSVSIRIRDFDTLRQAVDLALRAYDLI